MTIQPSYILTAEEYNSLLKEGPSNILRETNKTLLAQISELKTKNETILSELDTYNNKFPLKFLDNTITFTNKQAVLDIQDMLSTKYMVKSTKELDNLTLKWISDIADMFNIPSAIVTTTDIKVLRLAAKKDNSKNLLKD